MIRSKKPLRTTLNSAGLLALDFIHSKLSLLIIIASLLFGVLALKFTPRTYNPEIVVPVINISISRPGSDAEEMLHQILRPLEALMASIPGVEHTYGMALDDQALVTVRFKVNENEESSLVKVYNQINSNMDKIPAGTQPPLIQSVSLYDVPVLTLTLSTHQGNNLALREQGLLLLEQLRAVPQVGKSWLAGQSPTAVRVWLDPEKMAEHFLSVQQVQQALLGNNVSLNAGKLEPDSFSTPLRLESGLVNPEQIGNVVVGLFNGHPVFLREIARIEKAPADDNLRAYFATGPAAKGGASQLSPAITLAIARQKGSNGVEVAKAVLQRLKEVQAAHLLSEDMRVSVTRDYGEDANEAVNTLIDHLGIAILSVVVLLVLFLGWREASIVIFSIPLILCIVLGIGWIAGQTINRITLFALILSLGLLVDDSIVVIENIHRHLLNTSGRNLGRIIVLAANEIGKPTIIATFTVILALIPMGFVSGMMGPFMAPIPFNAPLAMLVSLLIAYTVVPYLAYRWLKSKAKRHWLSGDEAGPSKKQGHSTLLHRVYQRVFGALMHSRLWRYSFYGMVLALLVLVLLQPLWQFIRPQGPNGPLSYGAVALKMLPDDNVNTFLIEIDAGRGSALSRTQRIAESVAAIVAANPYVTDYQIYLGEAAPGDFAAMVRGDALQRGAHYAQIRVNLMNKKLRKVGSHQIAQQVYEHLADIRRANPKAQIKLFETPPGPPVRSQMEAALYGPDYQTLRQLAEYISQSVFARVYGMINIDNSVTNDLSEYRLVVNRQAATFAGLIPQTLAADVQNLFQGLAVGTLHQPGLREPANILLKLPKLSRHSVSALQQLLVLNRQQQPVPLARVVSFEKHQQNKPVLTRDQYPLVYLSGEMLRSAPAYAVATVGQLLSQSTLAKDAGLTTGNLGFVESQPQNISKNQLFWLGEMRLTLDVFRDLGAAFIVAIVLIYILLTAFYRSFFIPLIIMGAIPLTIIGVFPGHWLMGQPFTATSMIGVIALAGIVVRNSLLLIDFILEHQRAGHDIDFAVMQSGMVRLTPIVLTAMAIVLGSAVMLSDPVFGGLAISLIFGALASTLLTLFLIPLIYSSWWRRRYHLKG